MTFQNYIKENMLGSEAQIEVYKIIEFLEKNKWTIIQDYQKEKNRNEDADVWKVMALSYLQKSTTPA